MQMITFDSIRFHKVLVKFKQYTYQLGKMHHKFENKQIKLKYEKEKVDH